MIFVGCWPPVSEIMPRSDIASLGGPQSSMLRALVRVLLSGARVPIAKAQRSGGYLFTGKGRAQIAKLAIWAQLN